MLGSSLNHQEYNDMTELQPPALNNSTVRLPLSFVTLLLIIINVGLFAWQIFTGVDVSQPLTVDALRWGADYAPLTYLEEPVRLFSSTFFHFGLIHLMLNMWALYIFGNVAEKTFGHLYYLALYLLAGIAGSLLSGYIDIRNSIEFMQTMDTTLFPHVSAGASGAVMGLGGALTLLSLFQPAPQQQFVFNRNSLLLVLGINLMMGFMISGINNAAHIGGMLMGVLLALLWYVIQRFKLPNISLLIVLILGMMSCWMLYQYNQQLVQSILPLWQEILDLMKTQLNYPS